MEFQRLLSNGPISQSNALEELDRRGLRGVTLSDLFFINHERPVAEFDESTQTWVPIGTATPRDDSAKRARFKIGKPLTNTGRAELADLRARAGLTENQPQTVVHRVDPQWRTIAKEAIRGLSDEYSQAVREVAKQEVHLEGGRRHSATDGRDLAVYQLQEDLEIREGSTATLVLGAQHDRHVFEVNVVSRFGTELTLSVPKEMPNSPSAKLRIDLTWIVGKQRARLSDLLEQPERFNTTAALALVTAKPSGPTPTLVPHPPETSLNSQQNLAVQHGMTPKLTWVWGPPGTGKTTTLSILIRDLLAAGKRVLLCGPTNTAVDVALVGALSRFGNLEAGRVVRVGQPVNPNVSNRHVPVLVEEIAAARGQEIAQRAIVLREELTDLTKRLNHAARTQAASASKERLSLQRQLAGLKELISQLDGSLRDVRRQVVSDAFLVAATAHQSALDGLQDQRFDTVVIDEASMMTATLAMLVAGLGTGHTVVAGDFRQLSPVAVSDTPASHKWLHDSPFEASGVASSVRRGSPPVDLVALTTQHRMRPLISHAVSTGFYPESPLKIAESVVRRSRPTMPFGASELVAIDTSGLHAWMGRRGGLTSRFNLMHAQIAASIAASSRDVDAAFITPFNCQAALLRPFTTDLTRGEASTVHKFQGGEADLVVYDCVDASGSNFRLHDWFANGSAGGTGARLMNVAASRAREQLVLLADFGRVHRQRGTVDAVYSFMRQFLADAHHVSWIDVVAGPNSPTSVHSDTESLACDIENADGPIEVRTTAVSPTTMIPLLGPLRDAAKRVSVTIWFSPESNGDIPTPLIHLLQSDVFLRPARPVQESMAVVGSVVWSASGAFLYDGPGTWLRTEHPGLAEAARMAVRRRTTPYTQGTDQAAERCQCGRPLARVEAFQRAPEMICLFCEPVRSSRRTRPRERAI